jgi:hypothetical protein
MALVGPDRHARTARVTIGWKWEPQSRTYGNYGNANQWTVNAGLPSLARETAQNTNDARTGEGTPELVYTFFRLQGTEREEFLGALRWTEELAPHLEAMATSSGGAVAAGQLKSGLEDIQGSGSIVLLRIADYGCHGLTGPEFPDATLDESEFGNFIKLCRLDLFSGKNEAAGGSFGLGKAVYWRFSRLQTVLFNSCIAEPDRAGQRLIGVNQGVMHRLDEEALQGRGYFGLSDAGDIASVWDNEALIDSLRLTRGDTRSGTSALLIGFYDPDRPNLGSGAASELLELANELRDGLEENFWPLLARQRLKVRIEVFEGSDALTNVVLNPETTYTELVRALRRFDTGDLDDILDEPLSTVARDVPITIAKRKTAGGHESFVHPAKLVVTVSDDKQDSLENRVCLFRKPEMVVETIDREFEGRTYHAFLIAGAAINPTAPSDDELHADDFLRFAEPPSHDRWIPGRGRGQTSQANLTAHYVAPWVPNLVSIQKGVLDALFELFGAPPPVGDRPPEAIFKHLRFLRGEAADAAGGGGARRKPEITLLTSYVKDGRWHVRCQVEARNRREGWSMDPQLALVGLQGRQYLEWERLEVVSGSGEFDDDGRLSVPAAERKRHVTTTFDGVSSADLPLPATETMVEAVIRNLGEAAALDDGGDKT